MLISCDNRKKSVSFSTFFLCCFLFSTPAWLSTWSKPKVPSGLNLNANEFFNFLQTLWMCAGIRQEKWRKQKGRALKKEKNFSSFHPTRFVQFLPPPQFVIAWTYLEFLISFHSFSLCCAKFHKYENILRFRKSSRERVSERRRKGFAMALSWLSVSCKTDFLSPTIVTREALHKFDLFFLCRRSKKFQKENLPRQKSF